MEVTQNRWFIEGEQTLFDLSNIVLWVISEHGKLGKSISLLKIIIWLITAICFWNVVTVAKLTTEGQVLENGGCQYPGVEMFVIQRIGETPVRLSMANSL